MNRCTAASLRLCSRTYLVLIGKVSVLQTFGRASIIAEAKATRAERAYSRPNLASRSATVWNETLNAAINQQIFHMLSRYHTGILA